MFKGLIVRSALVIGPNVTTFSDALIELRPKDIHKRAAVYALGYELKHLIRSDNLDPFSWQVPAEATANPTRSLLQDALENYPQVLKVDLSQLSSRQQAIMDIQLRFGYPAYRLCKTATQGADAVNGMQSDTLSLAVLSAHFESRQELAVNIEKLLCLRDPREQPLLTTTQWAKTQRKAKLQPA